MSRHATDVPDPAQECAPSPPLPADHVLSSGAVLFPGAFDQHGCPLIVFPVDGQAKLSSELSKAEVVGFINYFLCLHKKKQEKDGLVSVVADLRLASPHTSKSVAEVLLLLELQRRTVHTVYLIQPKKKDVVKLLLKVLAPSAKTATAAFKKVLLREVSELSNYIDRSQLPASLGGYLVYSHQSWVAFVKEIDGFVQEFLSVVQRLPLCISTLQALSRLPLPPTSSELQHFCCTNEAKFQQLRRELGLDELLRHCESVLEKLRYPERERCYQDMAGTALFTHTAFDMLQNHSRLTAAVEKVEQLWHQAFFKARVQLQVFQLREDALQITEKIEALLQKRLQPYDLEIAKDAAEARKLVLEFETSIHTPAMALVRCAEDVIHTLAEILPFDSQAGERWVVDLERLKEKLHSAVNFILQSLRGVSSYHRYYNKANSWYSLAICENFLQDLLSGVDGDHVSRQSQMRNWGTIPAWRRKLSTFLRKTPPPDMEELVHLAHLSKVIPDYKVQQAGKQMSQRCMTLRRLLTSSGPVAVDHLQQALKWQYEFLRSNHEHQSSPAGATDGTDLDAQGGPVEANLAKCEKTPPPAAVSGLVSAEGKPASLSSFDSGFDGAGTSPLETWGGREAAEVLSRCAGTRDTGRPAMSRLQIHREDISSVSDSENHREEFDFGSLGNSSRASIQIIPNVTADSLNFEIKVKRSAALPSNPWLSLPVDDLENSYTVTITQNQTPQKKRPQAHDPSDPQTSTNQSSRTRDQPAQMEVLSSTQQRGQSSNRMLHSQSGLADPELSPISKVLSSTITDGRDQSICTTEGIPTLLWDSYDLHDQNQDADNSVIDVSLKGWDVKEQEELKEVEKILEKAGEILEEEENVLAQEVMLDALLRSEVRLSHWPQWDSEDQLGVMSSSELAEAGVLGFEDFSDLAESQNASEPTSAGSISESKAPRDGPCTDAAAERHSRTVLLTELREVHVLDKLIMEENLKIHELRLCRETPNDKFSGSTPLATNAPSSKGNEREAFREQLEREKKEVERLERSLDSERKVKHKSRAIKVVKCSIMEKARVENEEDQALCDALLSGVCNRCDSTAMEECDPQAEDVSKTGSIQAESSLELAEDDTPQDSRHEEPNCSEAEPSEFIGTSSNSSSDVREPSEELGIHHQGCKDPDVSSGNVSICKPGISLTPETRPDFGAFDPGGRLQPPPLPKPRKTSLPASNDLAEHGSPQFSEATDSASPSLAQDATLVQQDLQSNALDALLENVTSAIGRDLALNPNVHRNNNNNNHAPSEKSEASAERSNLSDMAAEDESGASGAPVQVELRTAQEVEASLHADERPPQAAHKLPDLEFDPGGSDEQNEDFPDGLQSAEVARSPGIQEQLNISTREMACYKTPIVLDTGSGLMKAGFADQDLPNIIFPTIIGQPKYEEIMNANLERDTYIGHEAQHMRGVLALKHPIKNGIICNWDEMEMIWHHTFQQLHVDPEDHPVLLTEAAMNPLENRQRMVEIMFECFNVPFTYVAMQAVLALYAAGRCTGVVFDSGDGVSHGVPVFEGYCLPHAVQRFPLAGVDVTMQLKRLLQEQGVCMRTTAEMEIVREMKEKCCRVALRYDAELGRGGSPCEEMHYTMPDGQIVTLGTERFRAPEILFKPELIGRDHYGLHESVFKSILSSDIDLRRCFLGNIVLSGGNTLLAGLPERLQAEITGLVPADMARSVRVSSPRDRDFSVWRGGAALAGLPSFSTVWISREEFEEFGPQIVFRKCF